MEIVLDRKLADKRTFPSIDINRSGTRKEELLLPEQDLQRVWLLRKVLLPMGIHDTMDLLLQKIKESKTNAEFLATMNSWRWKNETRHSSRIFRNKGTLCVWSWSRNTNHLKRFACGNLFSMPSFFHGKAKAFGYGRPDWKIQAQIRQDTTSGTRKPSINFYSFFSPWFSPLMWAFY